MTSTDNGGGSFEKEWSFVTGIPLSQKEFQQEIIDEVGYLRDRRTRVCPCEWFVGLLFFSLSILGFSFGWYRGLVAPEDVTYIIQAPVYAVWILDATQSMRPFGSFSLSSTIKTDYTHFSAALRESKHPEHVRCGNLISSMISVGLKPPFSPGDKDKEYVNERRTMFREKMPQVVLGSEDYGGVGDLQQGLNLCADNFNNKTKYPRPRPAGCEFTNKEANMCVLVTNGLISDHVLDKIELPSDSNFRVTLLQRSSSSEVWADQFYRKSFRELAARLTPCRFQGQQYVWRNGERCPYVFPGQFNETLYGDLARSSGRTEMFVAGDRDTRFLWLMFFPLTFVFYVRCLRPKTSASLSFLRYSIPCRSRTHGSMLMSSRNSSTLEMHLRDSRNLPAFIRRPMAAVNFRFCLVMFPIFFIFFGVFSVWLLYPGGAEKVAENDESDPNVALPNSPDRKHPVFKKPEAAPSFADEKESGRNKNESFLHHSIYHNTTWNTTHTMTTTTTELELASSSSSFRYLDAPPNRAHKEAFGKKTTPTNRIKLHELSKLEVSSSPPSSRLFVPTPTRSQKDDFVVLKEESGQSEREGTLISLPYKNRGSNTIRRVPVLTSAWRIQEREERPSIDIIIDDDTSRVAPRATVTKTFKATKSSHLLVRFVGDFPRFHDISDLEVLKKALVRIFGNTELVSMKQHKDDAYVFPFLDLLLHFPSGISVQVCTEYISNNFAIEMLYVLQLVGAHPRSAVTSAKRISDLMHLYQFTPGQVPNQVDKGFLRHLNFNCDIFNKWLGTPGLAKYTYTQN